MQYAEKGFRVLVDKYVTADAGTGIVHQAPAFGEDDHRIAIREQIVRKEEMPPCPIDDKGVYTDEVGEFLQGLYIKVSSSCVIYTCTDPELVCRETPIRSSSST